MPKLVHNKFGAAFLGWLGFAAAASGESMIFSAMGCGPYTPPDKPAVAFYVQQENRERISEFMVHLGDVFRTPTVKTPDADPASSPKQGGTVEPPLPCVMPTEAIGGDNQVSGKAGNSRITAWLLVVLTAAEKLE